jgi:hypothetical protein
VRGMPADGLHETLRWGHDTLELVSRTARDSPAGSRLSRSGARPPPRPTWPTRTGCRSSRGWGVVCDWLITSSGRSTAGTSSRSSWRTRPRAYRPTGWSRMTTWSREALDPPGHGISTVDTHTPLSVDRACRAPRRGGDGRTSAAPVRREPCQADMDAARPVQPAEAA